MKKGGRFTEEQIIGVLRSTKRGERWPELARSRRALRAGFPPGPAQHVVHGVGVWRNLRTIVGRIQRLENGLRLGPETEHGRQSREYLEMFRRCVAERRAREVPPLKPPEDRQEGLFGLSLADVLRRGRARAHASNRGRAEE